MFAPLVSALVVAFATTASAAKPHRNPYEFFSGDAGDMRDYLDWLETKDFRGLYYIGSDLDPADGAAIHWNIDDEQGILELAVAVRATGWLGFGISENGGMLGSDMLIYETLNPTEIKDAHVKDYRYPQMDACQSWELISSWTDTEFLIVEMRRKLNTTDSQDWQIINDANVELTPQRIIAAWGDTPYMGYHGAKTARSTIRWYGYGKDEFLSFRSTMREKALGSLSFVQENFNLLPLETRYERVCISMDDMRDRGLPIDQGVTLIGFEPVITSPWVHHFTLFGTDAPCVWQRSSSQDQLYSWAPGEEPLKFPDGVGIMAGGRTGFKTFVIEYHYTNMQRRSDLFDSSGIKFYYTEDPPEFEAGVFRMGDPLIKLLNEPVGTGLTEHDFECQPGCTEAFLDEPVTVFKDKLHMHESGTSMYTEHIRNGEVIRTHRVQYFDFEQQGSQTMIEEPYQLMPGDSFKTSCMYTNYDEDRVFGFGSEDEMCIHLMMYYPRKHFRSAPFLCGPGVPKKIHACEGTYSKVNDDSVLQNSMDHVRPFGVPAAVCSLHEEKVEEAAPVDKLRVPVLEAPPIDEAAPIVEAPVEEAAPVVDVEEAASVDEAAPVDDTKEKLSLRH